MSAVRIHTPDVNLAKLIRKPGGKAVADALSGASEGLKQMSSSVVSELKATLAAAETCLAANPTGAAVEELYLIVARPIGRHGLFLNNSMDDNVLLGMQIAEHIDRPEGASSRDWKTQMLAFMNLRFAGK